MGLSLKGSVICSDIFFSSLGNKTFRINAALFSSNSSNRIFLWRLVGASSGPKGGSVAFVLMVMALPVMPILGMPSAGGTARLLIAIVSSAVLWWFLGQVVAGRVTKRPVVGWREWLREFFVVGLGLWIGAAGGLLLGVLVLGVF